MDEVYRRWSTFDEPDGMDATALYDEHGEALERYKGGENDTTSRKLRAELEEAKQHLRNAIASAGSPPSSEVNTLPFPQQVALRAELNTLLGRKVVPERPLALYQQVGVAQRPTYDLIADRVLGPDVGRPSSFLDVEDSYASHVAHRLTQLVSAWRPNLAR